MDMAVVFNKNKEVIGKGPFIEDVKEPAGVSIYHLVKLLYQRMVAPGAEIHAQCVAADEYVINKAWRHTTIALYGPGVQLVPQRLVIVAENPEQEMVTVGFPGAEDLLRADDYHYYDLHDAVNSIGFFLVHGRKRSVGEAVADQLMKDAPKDSEC